MATPLPAPRGQVLEIIGLRSDDREILLPGYREYLAAQVGAVNAPRSYTKYGFPAGSRLKRIARSNWRVL